MPLYFLKNSRSIIGPGAAIRPPAGYAGKVLYEGELGIVIGRTCTAVDEAAAEAAIFGYTAVNDVTALDLLTADASFPQWARAKGCDTFGPIGPAIATGLDWSAARVKVALNGRVRQDYPAADMILPPARIVSLISREMTLAPRRRHRLRHLGRGAADAAGDGRRGQHRRHRHLGESLRAVSVRRCAPLPRSRPAARAAPHAAPRRVPAACAHPR